MKLSVVRRKIYFSHGISLNGIESNGGYPNFKTFEPLERKKITAIRGRH